MIKQEKEKPNLKTLLKKTYKTEEDYNNIYLQCENVEIP